MRRISFATALAAANYGPRVKEWVGTIPSFFFEGSAMRAAHELSQTDWRDWLPLSILPFEDFILEWRPSSYVTAQDGEQWETMGAVISAGSVGFNGVSSRGHLDTLPFAVTFPSFVANGYEKVRLPPEIHAILWGPKAYKQFGEPPVFPIFPMPLVDAARSGSDPARTIATMVKNLRPLYMEVAGILRVFYAQLALLNIERPTLICEPRFEGKRFVKSNHVRNYVPQTVVIRPDAIRRVSRAVAERDASGRDASGRKKAEHDVHAHIRRLRNSDGSIRKVVKVRQHTRGDASVGRVEKRYIVEMDPNKELNA